MLYQRLKKILCMESIIIIILLYAYFTYEKGVPINSLNYAFTTYLQTLPYLVMGVVFSAWAAASRLEVLFSDFFKKNKIIAIILVSFAGAISPLCSLLVVTFIVGLLRAKVPLSVVMSFWISSPTMDPSSFFLTQGLISLNFSLLRLGSAIFMGICSGFIILTIERFSLLEIENPLKENFKEIDNEYVQNKADSFVASKREFFNFNVFNNKVNRDSFFYNLRSDFLFFTKLLFIVFNIIFIITSNNRLLMSFVELIKKDIFFSVPIASVLGAFFYLNGLAATGIAKLLLEQHVNIGVIITFLMAGAATSIPAMSAVYPIVKFRIFLCYIFCVIFSSVILGYILYFLGRIV